MEQNIEWRGQQRLRSWDDYVHSDRFGRGTKDREPHFSLFPVPYMGNLEEAKVVLCLANPGFSPSDYRAEEDQKFRNALRNNLSQRRGLRYPFIALNPQFGWTMGFDWAERRLRSIVDRLTENGHCPNYIDALQKVSKDVAILELFPYHSRDTSALKGMSGNRRMPSVLAARDYLAELCTRRDKITIVMRRHKDWRDTVCKSPGHYMEAKPARGAFLSEEHQNAIFEKLTE